MFARAAQLVLGELRAYIASSDEEGQALDAPEYVTLGNIAMADVPELSPPIAQRMVASVVNIAEEPTFKNHAHYERSDTGVRYRNAPAFVNLFLLFSANYDNYETALRRLSQVVTFFQGKQTFSLRDAPSHELLDADEQIRVVLELVALTFEQVNYLWASLGGKQMPFALYKVRLVRVQADRSRGEGPLIEEIVSRETEV